MGRHHEEAAAPVTGQYKLVWFEWSIPSVYASPETRLGHACVALTVLLQPQLRITRASPDSHLAFASTQARAEAGAGPVLGPVEGGAGGLQPAAEASAIDLGGNPVSYTHLDVYKRQALKSSVFVSVRSRHLAPPRSFV